MPRRRPSGKKRRPTRIRRTTPNTRFARRIQREPALQREAVLVRAPARLRRRVGEQEPAHTPIKRRTRRQRAVPVQRAGVAAPTLLGREVPERVSRQPVMARRRVKSRREIDREIICARRAERRRAMFGTGATRKGSRAVNRDTRYRKVKC